MRRGGLRGWGRRRCTCTLAAGGYWARVKLGAQDRVLESIEDAHFLPLREMVDPEGLASARPIERDGKRSRHEHARHRLRSCPGRESAEWQANAWRSATTSGVGLFATSNRRFDALFAPSLILCATVA